MNKILTKVMAGVLGLTTAIGVGISLSNTSIRQVKAETSPDFVLVKSFDKDRDDYYLSTDGNKFGIAERYQTQLYFKAFQNSATLKASFLYSQSSEMYSITLTEKSGYHYYLNHPTSGGLPLNSEVTLLSQDSFAPIIWNVSNDGVGYYIYCPNDNNQYVGVSSGETPYARMYTSGTSHQTERPVYLYEKSSTAAAYAFADQFNNRLGTICQTDGSTNLDDLRNAWNGVTVGDVKSLKTIYKDLRDTLSSSEQKAFDDIFTNTTPKASGNSIEKALSLYKHLVNNRGLVDFITSIANGTDSSLSNPNLGVSTDNFTKVNILVIVAISISLVGLISYLAIRKKKESNK